MTLHTRYYILVHGKIIKSWRKLYFEKSLYSRWIILSILRIILTHCASQISSKIFGLEVFGLSMCESGRDVGAMPPKVFSMCGYSSGFSLGCPSVGCCLWRVWVPTSCHKLSLKYLKASPAVLLVLFIFLFPRAAEKYAIRPWQRSAVP